MGRTLGGICIVLLVLALAGLISIRGGPGLFAPLLPLIAATALAALIVLVPPYYVAEPDLPQNQRQLLRTYLALYPYQSYIQRKDTVFLKGAYDIEMQYYLGMADPEVVNYSVLEEMRNDEGLAAFFDRKKINLFFLDNVRWAQMESERPGVVQDLIEHGDAAGWRLVGFEDQPTHDYEYLARWLLFRKAGPGGGGGFDPTPAGLSAGRGNGAFAGWRAASGLGAVEGPYPQWNLPLICWGHGPATRLTIPAAGTPHQAVSTNWPSAACAGFQTRRSQ